MTGNEASQRREPGTEALPYRSSGSLDAGPQPHQPDFKDEDRWQGEALQGNSQRGKPTPQCFPYYGHARLHTTLEHAHPSLGALQGWRKRQLRARKCKFHVTDNKGNRQGRTPTGALRQQFTVGLDSATDRLDGHHPRVKAQNDMLSGNVGIAQYYVTAGRGADTTDRLFEWHGHSRMKAAPYFQGGEHLGRRHQ
ncbi:MULTISPECIES: hypothetical protein [Halomonadaceae]|uniref:hypothetical protein n=1 Tax=Halomonas sp. MCCC 1A17488 TaxID=2731555 RepID=UPI001F3A3496|nr:MULTISPECIES: hypothetical protein [Halomonas]